MKTPRRVLTKHPDSLHPDLLQLSSGLSHLLPDILPTHVHHSLLSATISARRSCRTSDARRSDKTRSLSVSRVFPSPIGQHDARLLHSLTCLWSCESSPVVHVLALRHILLTLPSTATLRPILNRIVVTVLPNGSGVVSPALVGRTSRVRILICAYGIACPSVAGSHFLSLSLGTLVRAGLLNNLYWLSSIGQAVRPSRQWSHRPVGFYLFIAAASSLTFYTRFQQRLPQVRISKEVILFYHVVNMT